MTTTVIIDVIAAAVLIAAAAWGAHRGLFRSLAGLAVVIVAAYRDGTGFDALKRLFSYGGGSEVTEETGYHYDASDSNRFAVLET